MPRWPGCPTPSGREIDPQNKSARPLPSMKHVASALVVPALAAGLLCASPVERAHAQAQGLQLQRSLGEPVPARGEDVPTFVAADRIEGLGSAEVEAIGDAELRRGDTRLTADRIKYFTDTDEVEATGNVRLRVAGDEAAGPRLRLRIGDTTGILEQPTFRFGERAVKVRGERQRGPTLTADPGAPMQAQTQVETRGTASALRFGGDEEYRMTDASFTTCKPGQDDWFIEAGEIDIDMGREVGTVRDARLTFLGVSTPRVPWFDFSLNNQRKSGFLPPSAGIQNTTGFDVVLPFYWNIAPNYDATIAPRYMAKRGMQFLNQFRFLQPWATGELRYDLLPNDQSRGDEQRYAFAANSNMNFNNGWSGLVNYTRASDDNYFRDLSGRLAIATQTQLTQQGLVAYTSPTGQWNAFANMQRFQTLQDPQNPIPEPYFREPQFVFNGLRQTLGGFDGGLAAEYVRFTNTALVPRGMRATAYPSVSLPLVRSYGYVLPKVGVNATWYDLTTPAGFTETSISRTLPIASLDSGLFFERGVNWAGSDFVQTLEPRVYYLYVPFEDQTNIPIFDTGNADLNFGQLFQENIFAGGDRIANANQVSIAATSRLVRPSDGQELVRAVIGQRYYFTDQKVSVPGQPVRTDSQTPLILGLGGRIAQNWAADFSLQYKFTGGQNVEKMTVGVRYSPAPAAVASVSYRYIDQSYTAGAGTINTFDVAAQWPLGRGFYGVGRVSYDIEGSKIVEALGGLEYSAGCWIVRAVVQQFQTATDQQTNSFFVQLELNGVARIGSNPIELLRRNIPGYTLINTTTPGASAVDIAPIGGQPPLGSASPGPIPGGSSSVYRYYD
jgi:LPS-assembly protein